MALSQREAASQWHLGRSTIQRAIKTGKLSLTPDKRVDTAEMIRVFGEPEPARAGLADPPKTTPDTAGLEADLVALRAENAGLKATLEAKDANLSDLRAEVLRLSHDKSEPARRRWWLFGKG